MIVWLVLVFGDLYTKIPEGNRPVIMNTGE
jgi:hypothetical protein